MGQVIGAHSPVGGAYGARRFDIEWILSATCSLGRERKYILRRTPCRLSDVLDAVVFRLSTD